MWRLFDCQTNLILRGLSPVWWIFIFNRPFLRSEFTGLQVEENELDMNRMSQMLNNETDLEAEEPELLLDAEPAAAE